MQGVGNATFRQDLADMLQENQLGAGQFLGMQIFPLFPVGAKSGKFAKLAFTEVKTAAVDDKRASTGHYNRITHEVTTDNYTCLKYGLEEPVDDDDAKTLAKYFNAELSAAMLCQYYLMLNREKRIADIAFDATTVMASYKTAAAVAWSTSATAVPVKDVEGAKNSLIDQLNGMVGGGARIIGIGNNSARKDLRASADVKDRVYGGGNKQAGEITEQQLADILGLDAVYFSGIKRAGSAVWSTTQFGIYVTSAAMEMKTVAHFGRIMLWRDSTPTDMMAESYREEAAESDIIRVKHNTDEKLLTARAGHLLTGIA